MPNKFTPPTRCQKCGGAMQPGAIVGNNVSSAQAGIFVEGTPSAVRWWRVEPREEKGLISGRMTKGMALVLPEGGPLVVLDYRCSNCGLLETYATPLGSI